MLIDYFDFMIYISNWGTKRIMMKFPPELVDYEFLKKYRLSDTTTGYDQDIRIVKKSGFVILDINYSEEEGLGWIDEEDHGYDFLEMRREIMSGDYQSLFVVWLRFLEDIYQSGEFDADYSFESSLIPPNLLHLSSTGYAVKDFYEVNQDWLDVMRSYAGEKRKETIDFEEQILKMPKVRMVEYLQLILKGTPNLKIQLTKELKGESESRKKEKPARIQLSEVGEKVTAIEQSRQQRAQEEKARQKVKRMHEIHQDQGKIEKEIVEHIERGSSKYYDIAVSRILELKAMNNYFDTEARFEVFLKRIASKYSRKSSFIGRLKTYKLMD